LKRHERALLGNLRRREYNMPVPPGGIATERLGMHQKEHLSCHERR
jgi:hypothetical protein